MKRILTFMMLVVTCLVSYCQSWDHIDRVTTVYFKTNEPKFNSYTDTAYNTFKVYDYNSVVNNYMNDGYVQEKIYCPTESVLQNYRIGNNCFNAGKVMVGFGLPVAFIGAMCMAYGNGKEDTNYDAIYAGATLLGIGGTMVSFSIPLMCFGDHIKRECNMIIGK